MYFQAKVGSSNNVYRFNSDFTFTGTTNSSLSNLGTTIAKNVGNVTVDSSGNVKLGNIKLGNNK